MIYSKSACSSIASDKESKKYMGYIVMSTYAN